MFRTTTSISLKSIDQPVTVKERVFFSAIYSVVLSDDSDDDDDNDDHDDSSSSSSITHEVNALEKTAIWGIVHILRKVLI